MLLYGSEIYGKEVLQFKTKSSLLYTIQRIPLVNLVRAYKSVPRDKLLDVTNVWSIEDEDVQHLILELKTLIIILIKLKLVNF